MKMKQIKTRTAIKSEETFMYLKGMTVVPELAWTKATKI